MNGLFSGHELVEAKHAGKVETHGRVEPIIDRAFRVNIHNLERCPARRLRPAQAVRPKICFTKDHYAGMSPLRACRKVFPRSVCERIALCRTCPISTMSSFLIAW
jgi:hypothetical protein